MHYSGPYSQPFLMPLVTLPTVELDIVLYMFLTKDKTTLDTLGKVTNNNKEHAQKDIQYYPC